MGQYSGEYNAADSKTWRITQLRQEFYMLDLKLRNEFLGTHMPGTAIAPALVIIVAAQQDPNHILAITVEI